MPVNCVLVYYIMERIFESVAIRECAAVSGNRNEICPVISIYFSYLDEIIIRFARVNRCTYLCIARKKYLT